MKKLFGFLVFCFAACSLILTGCGLDQYPPYSDNVKFAPRHDPLVKGTPAKIVDDRYEPDRPGVFPLMSLADIFNPEHPYHAKLMTEDTIHRVVNGVIDATVADAKKLTPEERKQHQEKLHPQVVHEPAKFQKYFAVVLDQLLRDPTLIPEAERKELEKALEAQFGTPAKPSINAKAAGIDEEMLKGLKLDDAMLKEGGMRYRVHCMHCHGVPGDGRGPTSRWINPHPRDFRRGIFKFQSVDQATDSTQRPPSRGDLLRTLRSGIEGTAMPTFSILHDDELQALVSYVMYLSIRGKTEYDTILAAYGLEESKDKGGTVLVWQADQGKAELIQFFAKKLIADSGGWKESNDPAKWITPVKYEEGDAEALAKSVQRGQRLFLGDETHPRGKNANCKQCHDDFGRQARFKLDDWGTFARPNNFPQGVFRGGRRPVDMYYRIHSGINGSGMNNFGKVLQGDDIWDLVNFVSSLSYPAMYSKLGIKIN